MGALHEKAIVKVSPAWGTFIFFANIVSPGWGTLIAGFLSKDALFNNWLVAVLQASTCVILVGWIWSINLGHQIYKKSKL